jgi:hypothetical protein
MESFILKRCGSHHWGYSYSLYWEVEGNTHLYRREQITNVIAQQGRERKMYRVSASCLVQGEFSNLDIAEAT